MASVGRLVVAPEIILIHGKELGSPNRLIGCLRAPKNEDTREARLLRRPRSAITCSTDGCLLTLDGELFGTQLLRREQRAQKEQCWQA